VTACSGPSCDREPVAHGLCPSHYRQQLRGRPLAPLRAGPARVHVSMRVSPRAAKRISRDYAGAVAAVEAWAEDR
jgi:hypothetical protein